MLAESGVFGADLLVWLVFALGAAMVVGNLLALLRPPAGGSARRSTPRRKGPARARGAKARAGGAKARGGKSTKKGSASRSARGPRGGDLPTAPLGRSVMMIAIGTLAVVWSLATLATR